MASEMPRRCRMDKWTPAEKAIFDAAQEVEKAGGDPLLTDAVVLLGQAREKVAAYVDGQRAQRLAKALWGPEPDDLPDVDEMTDKQVHIFLESHGIDRGDLERSLRDRVAQIKARMDRGADLPEALG